MNLKCGRMQMYEGQMYPPLIEPSATEHYYIRWAWHVEECIHTQGRCPPLIEPSATAGQLDMWKNVDVPMALLQQVSLTCGRMQMYPKGNLTYFALAYKTHLSCKTKRADKPPQKHISWFQQASDANHLCSPILTFGTTFQWLFTVVYLHDITTYSCNKCMQMLSGLCPTNFNSFIPFHEQYSVLLHKGTTFKELLSLIFYRKRTQLCKVTLTFTFIHQVSLTCEDADIHSAESNWEGSGHKIWPLEHWGIYVDWCVLFLFLLLLLLNVVLVVHLSLWINNYSWTRTTTTLHSNNNINPSKKIAQFIYIDVFVVVVVTK